MPDSAGLVGRRKWYFGYQPFLSMGFVFLVELGLRSGTIFVFGCCIVGLEDGLLYVYIGVAWTILFSIICFKMVYLMDVY